MKRYIGKRALSGLLVVLLSVCFNFTLIRLAPGDPIRIMPSFGESDFPDEHDGMLVDINYPDGDGVCAGILFETQKVSIHDLRCDVVCLPSGSFCCPLF